MTEAPIAPIPHRATRVAALHALAAWIAEHPDIDTPDRVTAIRVLPEREYPTAEARCARVVAFARRHGLALREGPLWVWADVPIATYDTHGVSVEYALYASKANERLFLPPHPRG